MKYRKRPVVVEATQWFPGAAVAGVVEGPAGAHVVTIHGHETPLAPGDFVVTESDGIHHYPVKPAEFARIYEPAE